MPRSSSPPKGGLVRITSTRSLSPISLSLKRRLLPRIDLRRLQPVQEQVHLASRYGSGFASPPKMLCFCRTVAVLDRLALLLQVLERLDQEAAGAAGRVEDGFAELRVGDLDHEPHDGARRVELAGVAGRVAHLPEHRLVEMAERVDLVAGGEVDAVDLVDHVAQQVAAHHAVDRRR